MDRMSAEISRGHKPIRDLPLNGQIPLSGLHVGRAVSDDIDQRERRPRRIAADGTPVGKWERVSAGIVSPRKFQVHVINRETREVGRCGRKILILRVREIIKNSDGTTYGGAEIGRASCRE